MRVDVDEGSSSLRLRPQRQQDVKPSDPRSLAFGGGGRLRPEPRTARGVLQLQHLAGNAAVVSRLADPSNDAVPVQRACACGGKDGDQCNCG